LQTPWETNQLAAAVKTRYSSVSSVEVAKGLPHFDDAISHFPYLIMTDLFKAQPLEQPKVDSIQLDDNVLEGRHCFLSLVVRVAKKDLKFFLAQKKPSRSMLRDTGRATGHVQLAYN
jgi:hypothetical protein